jgi:hypothetical protein
MPGTAAEMLGEEGSWEVGGGEQKLEYHRSGRLKFYMFTVEIPLCIIVPGTLLSTAV